MPQYRIVWRATRSADTPEEAIAEALRDILNPTAGCRYFHAYEDCLNIIHPDAQLVCAMDGDDAIEVVERRVGALSTNYQED